MNEPDLRKQLLRERVQANREMVRLEVDGIRAKLAPALGLVRLGRDLLPPVGLAAASAARAVSARRAQVGGAAGLAAIVPVILAVAKLVAGWQRKGAAAPETPEHGAEGSEGTDAATPRAAGAVDEEGAPDDS